MNPYLFPGLPIGPRVIRELVGRIPDLKLDTPTHPDRFTPREVVAHLADWEPILLGRMRQTVEKPGSEIIGLDEGLRAIEQDYVSKDPVAEANRFMVLREQTIAWLRERAPEDWVKVGVHNERGPQSLADQANLLLGHDLYHIDQLIAAMGA